MKNGIILLIGDSITEGFDTAGLLPQLKIKNRGVSGDSTVETLGRMPDEWFTPPPEEVFICIGTNDFARFRKDEYILANIALIAQRAKSLSPDSRIWLTTIFPTRNNAPRPNRRIDRFNLKLKELADSSSYSFFDISGAFKDGSGMLKAEYTADGLHINAAAYRLWSELLMKAVD